MSIVLSFGSKLRFIFTYLCNTVGLKLAVKRPDAGLMFGNYSNNILRDGEFWNSMERPA